MNHIRRLYPQEMKKIAEAQRQPPASASLDRSGWPEVTVVILSLDRLHLTRRCIDSLYANSDYPFQLLIWDNGSQAATINYLHELETAHDNLRVIYSDRNWGCGGGRNRAVEFVNTEYFFSLDNDMICLPGWLRETMACAVRHQADFVVPMRLNVDGTVWSACPELIQLPDGTLEIARWFHDLPAAALQALLPNCDLPINFVPGGASLFATQIFRAMSGFIEDYKAGFEDIEFLLRLRERDCQIWATTSANLIHDNEWQPQQPADEDYAQHRFDIERLKQDSLIFKQRWNLEVLPEKYIERFQHVLKDKLAKQDQSACRLVS